MGENIDFQKTGKNILKQLNKMYGRAAEELKICSEEYKLLPKGNICIKVKQGRQSFYERTKGQEKSICRDKERIKLLMRKKVLENEMQYREIFCDSLKRSITTMENQLAKDRKRNGNVTLNRIYSSGCEICLSYDKSMADWIKEKYERNPYRIQELKYESNCGIKVRSKSEKIIADKLWESDVPFHYEPQMVINGYMYYPDFVIRKSTGKIIIWEHFGMMENEEYRSAALRKIENYNKAGFRQHTDFICTYEEDIMRPSILDEIIERFLL